MVNKRERRIEVAKRRLLRTGMPRFQVTLILLLTGLAGFLTSFSLLHLGIPWMWVRYPIAILIAYGVFLLLLGLWLWLQRRNLDLDLDLQGVDFSSSDASSSAESFDGCSDFGGGGAGGSWGESVASSSSISGKGSSSGAFDLDLGEGCLVVLAVAALIGGLIASIYVVYIAPVLLAEILVDGVLLAGLYKRVKGIEQRHWLRAAVRQTILPALLATFFFTVAGYALQIVAPEARSIGEVWNHIRPS